MISSFIFFPPQTHRPGHAVLYPVEGVTLSHHVNDHCFDYANSGVERMRSSWMRVIKEGHSFIYSHVHVQCMMMTGLT